MTRRRQGRGAVRVPVPKAVFSNRLAAGQRVLADSDGLRSGAKGLLELRGWLETMFADLDSLLNRAHQVVLDDSLDPLVADIKRAREASRLIETDLNTTAMRLDELAARADGAGRI